MHFIHDFGVFRQQNVTWGMDILIYLKKNCSNMKLSFQKPVIYGSMIGGWAVGLYFFNFLWSNFQPLLIAYKEYVIWYTIIMGFISFVICYKIGSPKDARNKNIISWTLQGVALIAIYYSTNIPEFVIIIGIVLFMLKYTPDTWIRKLKLYW